MRAYVLIQTEVGKADQVANSVRKLKGVSCADTVTGIYDVIATVESSSVDELGQMVVREIQMVDGITRTLTCPALNMD